MLNTRERLLKGALRRVTVRVRDVTVIRHPIVEILPRLDAVAAIAHKLDKMPDLDGVPLAAAVLQVAIQQRRPERH